jgi:hypothetical protein
MAVANTLAYCDMTKITAVKSFMGLSSDAAMFASSTSSETSI